MTAALLIADAAPPGAAPAWPPRAAPPAPVPAQGVPAAGAAPPWAAPAGGALEAKRIARHGTVAERLALAARPGTPPELLYFLANDAAFVVRAAVASNAASPPQADRVLAGDADERVRAILGRKLAGLAPLLGAAAAAGPVNEERLRHLAWETLCRLAGDAADVVRAMIAEEVKAMPDAPRALVLRLARDAAMAVAEPVIRFSPLLTEEDLLALVLGPPVAATLTAVARRPGLGEAVSDAIAATGDVEAVGTLLANPSAAIREATLDAVIAGAGAHPAWQERLVIRPVLPAGSARALARIVADHLLGALAARPDLDPCLAAGLRERVAARLGGAAPSVPADRPQALPAGAGAPATPAAPAAAAPAAPPPGAPAAAAAAGAEQAFAAAARTGDRPAMLGLLAERSGLPLDAVRRAAQLRSAKGLIALCWKAGLTPRCGLIAQTVLAGIAPALALPPAPGGGWPLQAEEMAWQIALLAEPVA